MPTKQPAAGVGGEQEGGSRSTFGTFAELARSKLARDTGWSFLLKLAHTGLAFLVTVMLARLLGAHGYGIYAYAYALVTLLALPAQAGLPTLLVRETASGLAEDRPDLVQGVWRWAGGITGVLSVVLALGGGAVLLVGHGGRLDAQGWTIVWAFAMVPLVALGNLRGAALRGLHRIVEGQLPESVLRPGLLVCLVAGLAIASGGGLSAPLAMALHVIAAAVAFTVGAWLLWRNAPAAVRNAEARFRSRAWLASTVPLALMTGMQVVHHQTDILMLGLFEAPDQVGLYRVATQASTLAAFGLQAVNMVVAPRFAQMHARGDAARLQRLVTGSARVVLAFNLVITALFLILGTPLLKLVFGSAFGASFLPLSILLIGQLINSVAGSVGFLLNMTGHERQTARAMAVAAVINIVLNLLLIPLWGTMGAATATAASLITWNVSLWWAVRQRLGINSLAFRMGPKRVA